MRLFVFDRRSQGRLGRLAGLWLVVVMSTAFGGLVGVEPARAQPTAAQPVDDTDTALDALRRQIDTTQRTLRAPDTLDDEGLLRLRTTTIAAQAQADGIANRLAPDVAQLDARIAQLGTAPPGTKEDADLSAQRAQLAKTRATLGDQQKLARLIAVEAQQLAVQLATLRRAEFQARLGERTDSILSARFWAALGEELPGDAERLAALGRQFEVAASRTPAGVWVGVPLAAAFGCWAIWVVTRRLLGWLPSRTPAGRLRRSLRALVTVLAWTASFGCVALALPAVLDWRRTLPATEAAFLANCGVTLWFGGFVYGLLDALILARRPSWRLLPIPDEVAQRLAQLPWLLTLSSLAAWITERLTTVVNASLSLTVAANGLVSIALGAILGVMLIRAARVWRREIAGNEGASRPVWLAVIGTGSWVLLGIAVLSLLAGYVAFGSFVVKQVVWAGVLVGATYLLAALVDDALMAWLAGAPGSDAPAPEAAAPRLSAQVAVLASALLRLVLVLVALMLLLAPFGEGPAELLRRGGQWQQGIAIGEVRLAPGAVLQALVVLVVGLLLVRLLRRWFEDRYLPTTTLDAGMRASTTSLFGYMGVVVAVALALSALGIGLERIAWVASALSVGIGFGLQAVVQNFVSGLILLAERPVKVGDWVSLGGVEGDIRRINVRATEIQQGDRSTVIVPNSEFITKTVRNVTLANPLGLVQLKLPLPLATDAERVRALLLEILAANEELVESPAPSVALDGIENGLLVFNVTGFVDSPRKAYNVRSALLFEVLKRFADAKIDLAKTPTMLLGNLAAAAPATLPQPAAPDGAR